MFGLNQHRADITKNGLILTDVRRFLLENNSLYVLQLVNELVVKRIQRKMNESLIVKSDNPNYESEELDELAAKSLHIIG
ncbi:helix-turn-helix transcriptional regulator [Nitrosomonas sp.]|uniref:S24 family peptidase n=1 Tax=Nitrosomonas sp. TaxID=42353 RepID=UPI00345E03F3